MRTVCGSRAYLRIKSWMGRGMVAEKKTVCRVAGVDWSPAPEWGLSLSIPYVDRQHRHNHNNDDGSVEPESWSFRGLGDVRVQARYQFFDSSSDPAAPRGAGHERDPSRKWKLLHRPASLGR